jgi:hypothetical protein
MKEHEERYFYENDNAISSTLKYVDTLLQEELQRLMNESEISDEERRKLLKDYSFDEFRNFAPVVHLDNMEG